MFDTIADKLLRLCDAWDAWVTRYEDGLLYTWRAGRTSGGGLARADRAAFSGHPRADRSGRCVLAASVIHVADVLTDPNRVRALREIATAYGWRSALAAPMLRRAR